MGRRRHEGRVAWTTPAHPVLRATHLAWLLVGAAHALHKARVRLVEQAHRQRQLRRVCQLRSREVEGIEIVADLLDVRALRTFVALGLEGEEIDEGRLRALDLRGDYRLLADEGVDEPVERGASPVDRARAGPSPQRARPARHARLIGPSWPVTSYMAS